MMQPCLAYKKYAVHYEHHADETQDAYMVSEEGRAKKWNLELRQDRDSNQKAKKQADMI